MKAVTVIDYGVGNLLSVARALAHCGADVEVTSELEKISAAVRLVLPGVGAFGDCINELRSRRMDGVILDFAASGRPLMGICVGMQILFDRGMEFGNHTGLALLSGEVVKIPRTKPDGTSRRLPHIGWSPLQRTAACTGPGETILSSVHTGDAVYFVHSFQAVPSEAKTMIASVDCEGLAVCAAVAKDNVFGFQFHPEKSGPTGLRILDSFLHL